MLNSERNLSILLFLIPASLVVSMRLNSIIIVLVTGILLYSNIKNKQLSFDNLKYADFGYFLIILYTFSIDFFRGNELDYQRIVMSLSFLVFPFYSIFKIPLSVRDKIIYYYSYLIVIINSLLILNLIANYLNGISTFGSPEFRAEVLDPLSIHPTYYSLFILLSLVYLVRSNLLGFGWIKILGIILNLAIIFFVTSKGAIFSLIILSAVFLWYLIRSKELSKYYLLVIPVIIYALYITPMVNIRFHLFIDTLLGDGVEYSTSRRMLLYERVFDALSLDSSFWGYGITGGYSFVKEVSKLNFNMHNQFLQVYINGGFIGVVLFVSYLSNLAIRSFKRNDVIYLLFNFIVMFNLLFENVFDRQWGIVFFTFFTALFCVNSSEKTSKFRM